MSARRNAPIPLGMVNAGMFWARVERSEGCWTWTGHRQKGYGRFQLGGRGVRFLAHRVAWALVNGDPGAMDVLHRCDNPPCCNPAHLFLGDVAANNADKTAKGRQSRGRAHGATFQGERHGSAILTERAVRSIRAAVAGGLTQASQARLYGVSPMTISDVVNRKRWRHVDAQPHEARQQ